MLWRVASLQSCLLICLLSSIRVCSADIADFFPYGTAHGDDKAQGDGGEELILRMPFFLYGASETELHVNINGLLTFRDSAAARRYVGNNVTFPIRSAQAFMDTPIIAPLWSSLSLVVGGTVFFRQSSEAALLERAVGRLSVNNSQLGANFSPKLVVVATWKEVAFDNNPATNVTFQVVLATDGQRRSFAMFSYGFIHPSAIYLTGFYAGDTERGVVVSTTDPFISNKIPLRSVDFRTDGTCISLSSLSSSCHINASSTNCSLAPSFQALSCTCLQGYSNTSGTCQDIDECSDESRAQPICPAGSSGCINTNGSYQCPCEDGYYGNDFDVCEDIDECALNISNCALNASCMERDGGFDCNCSTGFLGNGQVCTPEDAVTSCVEGSPNCVCEGGGSGRVCYCASGFNITGTSQGNCEDIDECAGGTELCTQRCVNSVGSYFCTCLPGYSLNATDRVTCINIDECVLGLDDCHANANCTDTLGSYTCTCHSGFNGDGRNCSLQPICSEGTHPCEQICLPVNQTLFECLCPPGYLLNPDGITCSDLDECAGGVDNCHSTLATCANTDGSFTCTCSDGYYGNGVVCVDIDECAVGLHNCTESMNCTNDVGGFSCNCGDRFPDPTNPDVCIDGVAPDIQIFEFERPITSFNYSVGEVNDFCIETDVPNPPEFITIHLFCRPILGIFPPPQNPLWKATLFNKTSQRNEFEDPLPDPRIYPDISVLENGTELQIGPIPFNDFTGANGLVPYDFIFNCRVNNRINFHEESIRISQCGRTECQHGITNNCTTACTRNNQQYTCSCDPGYRLQTDQLSCKDIDECLEYAGNCSEVEVCVNTEGSFMCVCKAGYRRMEGGECLDVDECSEGTHNCSLDSTSCQNTDGAFSCECRSGYQLSSESEAFPHSCEDLDECTLATHNCSEIQECVNMPGAFDCVCSAGYMLSEDNSSCVDMDECATPLHGCAGSCLNTNGSFTCSCPEGFQLAPDMFACRDVDECKLDPSLCEGSSLCINRNGSYECQCSTIFRMVGTQCEVSQEFLIPVIIVSFIVLILLVVIVLVLAFILSRRKLKKNHKLELHSRNNTYVMSGSLPRSPLPEIEMPVLSLNIPPSLMIPLRELTLDSKVLGSGEFGIVHKASYRGETVAVKTLKGFSDNSSIQLLVEEILKMKDFSHLNILTLSGVTLDNRGSPCLIMPFMSNGSLVEYLRKDKTREELLIKEDAGMEFVSKATQKLMNFCLQIGNGMEYLSQQKVIHRDLAARNCMMDMRQVIKVADFGLSVSVSEDKDYFRAGEASAEKLPVKWMAPESLSERKFSEYSDVWAYGVTCWEVFSCGKVPYPTVKAIDLLVQIRGGYKMAIPDNAACTDQMYNLMLSCWEYEASDRPNFSKIVYQLSEILALASDYLSFDMTYSPSAVGGLQDQLDQEEERLVNGSSSSPSRIFNQSSDEEEREGEELLENHTASEQDEMKT